MINIEEKSKRLDYFDLSRGIAIILVMLGHIYKNESNIIRIWLYSFHLPIFFIISGSLAQYFSYKKYTIKEYFAKKLKNLFVPYIIFSFINAVFYLLYSYLLDDFSKELIYSTVIKIITLRGLCGTWFLPCLFGCEMIFFILNKIFREERYVKFIILCLFIFSFSNMFSEDSLMCVFIRMFTATGFFAVGYYMYNFIEKVKPKTSYILLLLILNIIMTIYNGHVEIYLILYKNPLIYVINSIIGSFMVILLCKKIKKQKFLSFMGRNSLIVLVTHFIIVNMLITVYLKILGSINEYVDGFIILIISIFIEIIVIKVYNKFLKR